MKYYNKRNSDAGKPGPKPRGDPVVKIGLAFRPEVIERLDQIAAKLKLGRSQALASLVMRYRLESERPTLK